MLFFFLQFPYFWPFPLILPTAFIRQNYDCLNIPVFLWVVVSLVVPHSPQTQSIPSALPLPYGAISSRSRVSSSFEVPTRKLKMAFKFDLLLITLAVILSPVLSDLIFSKVDRRVSFVRGFRSHLLLISIPHSIALCTLPIALHTFS